MTNGQSIIPQNSNLHSIYKWGIKKKDIMLKEPDNKKEKKIKIKLLFTKICLFFS